jgi:hypothetical protein
MRIAWMFILTACIGWAQGALQNSEFYWLFGGVSSSSAVVPGTDAVISGSAGFALQFGYDYQLKSTKAGNLWIEAPMTYTFSGTGTVSNVPSPTLGFIASVDRNNFLLTPGLRLKSPTYGRVSIYGALGGGFGTFSKIEAVVTEANGSVIANYRIHISPAFDFAGGIDVRLSRLLSLRGEGRDFVTAANLGGVSGHNHPVFLAGLAFHF